MGASLSTPLSILARLESFRQESRVRAGSLIISVFGDCILPRGGRIWLGSLIRLLQPLGISERLVRTSVYRLAKEEWLQAETWGRRADYMLTASGRQRFQEASRLIYASRAPCWDHRWRLIFLPGSLPAQDREQLRRALFWQGFGMLGGECFVHPGADLEAVFDSLAAEGFAGRLGCLMPMLAAEAEPGPWADAATLVKHAWNLEALARAYAAFVATYRPILQESREADSLDEEVAFLLRLLLIHDYRRLLLRDPDLPEVLLPARWPGREARLLCREIYHRMLRPSEAHLTRLLRLADGTVPGPDAGVALRFSPDEAPGR